MNNWDGFNAGYIVSRILFLFRWMQMEDCVNGVTTDVVVHDLIEVELLGLVFVMKEARIMLVFL